MNHPIIIVHGGAWYIRPEDRDAYREGCQQAARAGWACLQQGGSALDAVEIAVRLLEDDPTFDAGRGSYFNQAGEIEMDAIVMDGRMLELGAVASVRQIRHPVSLARAVLERCPYNLLVGRGAEAFAWTVGIPLCDPATLLGKSDLGGWGPGDPIPSDTVGAVAMDGNGNLAVATSTGGTPDKLPGRVGDSPLVGCGAYADNASAAASATGWGETLMRIVISKTACDWVASGMSAQCAAEAAIRRLSERVGGYGGIILIDRDGRVGLAHNTPNMSYAYILPDQDMVSGVRYP